MKIAIFGAGSIGVYVGASLLLAGADVTLIGRVRMRERLEREGLILTDLEGRKSTLSSQQIKFTDDPAALASADLILVTVKSADTGVAANAIRDHAVSTAVVLSLQNGIGNVDVLRQTLPGWTVLAGMVPFNVVQLPQGRIHRGTAGELMAEASPQLQPWLPIFEAAHLPLIQTQDFESVQWGKLLLNLNNPVNALSGLPLRAQLSTRAFRRCFALLISEALALMAVAGIKPAKVTRVGPKLLPILLRLPDAIFTRVASAMLRIDPEARSSMWEDLQANRRTEVDYLNGAVVKLAESIGRDAPANRSMVSLIRNAEKGRHKSLGGDELLRELVRKK